MIDNGLSFEQGIMFRDRTEAGHSLAKSLDGRKLRNPLVLAIPRGGVAVGSALARDLRADLDVILSRKLRAPSQPELGVGAIAENGEIYINPELASYVREMNDYLQHECRRQIAEIRRRRQLVRAAGSPAPIEGRSVIVTDDGIATGSTMIAALQSLKGRRPYEVIVAVPVASPERLEEVRHWCDEVICLAAPAGFRAVGQFYEQFPQLEDSDVVRLLSSYQQSTTESASEET
jgi:predicted phosphoribosyltransferase